MIAAYADWIFIALVGVLGWVFRYEHQRISAIENRVSDLEKHNLSREEFNGAMESIRTELRARDTQIMERIAELATAVFSLKRDENGGR